MKFKISGLKRNGEFDGKSYGEFPYTDQSTRQEAQAHAIAELNSMAATRPSVECSLDEWDDKGNII